MNLTERRSKIFRDIRVEFRTRRFYLPAIFTLSNQTIEYFLNEGSWIAPTHILTACLILYNMEIFGNCWHEEVLRWFNWILYHTIDSTFEHFASTNVIIIELTLNRSQHFWNTETHYLKVLFELRNFPPSMWHVIYRCRESIFREPRMALLQFSEGETKQSQKSAATRVATSDLRIFFVFLSFFSHFVCLFVYIPRSKHCQLK